MLAMMLLIWKWQLQKSKDHEPDRNPSAVYHSSEISPPFLFYFLHTKDRNPVLGKGRVGGGIVLKKAF